MSKIAFIDDQQNELDSVRALLANGNHNLERHRAGEFALAAFQRRMPDLIVINLPPSGNDGMTMLERIRDKWIVPVIMLGSTHDEVDEIMALRLGADDFIHKPLSPRLLAERINGLLRRNAVLINFSHTPIDAEQVLVQGDIMMDPGRHEVIWKEQQVTLTVTEFRLLISLVRRPGIVKNREHLMSEIYSDEIYVDDRTIDSHIKRIRKKIRAVDPEFDAIETLYGIGYRYVMPSKALVPLRATSFFSDRHLAA